MKLTLRAPAKINWFLTISGKRPDGYHEILSMMECVSLYDDIAIEEAEDIELVSDFPLPSRENLVVRAADLLRQRTGCRRGVKIHLRKAIPAAAGLGGGSSDAAHTMIALNRFWDLNLDHAALAAMGASLGSDIPFFMGRKCAVVSGRGEQVHSLERQRSFPVLLVKPSVDVSTAWAYGAYRHEKLTKKPIDIKLFCHALENGDFEFLRRYAQNDLEGVVAERFPIVREIMRDLREDGALFSAMSGSGPTVFGVFPSEESAVRSSGIMKNHWHAVARTIGNER